MLAEVGSDWPDLQLPLWPSAAALTLAVAAVAAAAAVVVVEHAVAELAAELAVLLAAGPLVAADAAVFFGPVLVVLVVLVVVPAVAPVENAVDEQVKGHHALHHWLAALLRTAGGSWLDLACHHFASVVRDALARIAAACGVELAAGPRQLADCFALDNWLANGRQNRETSFEAIEYVIPCVGRGSNNAEY